MRQLVSTLLLACTAAWISGCASLPVDAERIESHVIKNTDDTHLGRIIVPLVNQHPEQSGISLLIEGMDALIARLALIKTAEISLDLQYYIWHEDLTGKVMHNALLHAADRGVRVRLLLDDFDTVGKDDTLRIIDSHPNIEIRLFNPFANRRGRAADFFTDLRRVNRRMHNKTFTADNQVTILGGRNIGNEYFDATEDMAFNDLDALGIGPIANDVSTAFDLYWNSRWAYPISAFYKGESIQNSERATFRQKSDAYADAAQDSVYAQAVMETDLVKTADFDGLDFSWGKSLLAYDDPVKIEADKVDDQTHLAPQLLKALDKTKKDLIIISPYFVPGTELTAYFGAMVERGVRVRILTNSLSANDVFLVHSGYMRYRKDLVNLGIELYEYKATKPQKAKKQADKKNWIGASRSSLHAKLFSFDERYLFVGSFNLDARSVALNLETGIFFETPSYAQQLSRDFDIQVSTAAYRVGVADDKLEWITTENNQEVRFNTEPATGWWARFFAGFLSIFVIESQL